MISRYSFGKPFETEALVVKIEATEGKLPFFRTDGEGNYYYDFDDKDIVYGLGEQIRGINKEAGHIPAGILITHIIMRIHILYMVHTIFFL